MGAQWDVMTRRVNIAKNAINFNNFTNNKQKERNAR